MELRNKIVIGIVISFLIVSIANNASAQMAEGNETFIAFSGGESKSAIYGDWVAWEYWLGASPSQIRIHNISSGEELALTPVIAQSLMPDIYEDKLVWRDFRHNISSEYIFEGIFLYNLTSGEETPLIESKNASHANIYGNKIVWTDIINGASDVYMYDISTGEIEQITTSGMANNAVIYGDTIAWLDGRNGLFLEIYT